MGVAMAHHHSEPRLTPRDLPLDADTSGEARCSTCGGSTPVTKLVNHFTGKPQLSRATLLIIPFRTETEKGVFSITIHARCLHRMVI